VLAQNVDQILLDNMTLAEMREAVALIAGRAKTEASGNMTLDRVADVAKTGVDFISVGALTHTIRSIDFSLELVAA
jgi:nicotinate-nucleotide pyrophosphorylase (carboxylating)